MDPTRRRLRLAKGLDQAAGTRQPATGGTNSPTVTSPAMTQAGMILGTAAYMAPEPARGKAVDKRADIWAFGAVLFEMLTGMRAFEGEDIADTLGAVMKMEPPWDRCPATVPPRVVRVMRARLQKNPRQRLDSALAVRLALDGAFDTAAAAVPVVVPAASPVGRRVWMAAAVVCAVIAALLATVHFREAAPPPAPLVRSTLLPPPGVTVDETSLAVSPDGTRVAFVATDRNGTRRLWVRTLDGVTAAPLAGTDGAFGPFWSPDSQSLGFFTDGKLRRIDAAGRSVVPIADTGQRANLTRGASWGTSGDIIFSLSGAGPLKRVLETGGTVTDATTLADGEITHRRPFFLPDGRPFVFSAGPANSSVPKTIRLGSLDGPDSTLLIDEADSGAAYDAGALLYVHGGTLLARPFDVEHLALAGDAVPLVDGVPGGGVPTTAGFSAGRGLLVHAAGSVTRDLTWFDRTGNRIGGLGEPGVFVSLNFSMDRRSLAVDLSDLSGVWLMDVARGLRTRLTSGGDDQFGTLSPDGRMVLFTTVRNNRRGILRKRVDGVGSEERLYEGVDARSISFTVSPDGNILVYEADGNLWVLPDPLGAPGTSTPRPLFQTPFSGRFLQFSPDGRWIAYQSNRTGRTEVYVMPYPGPGPSRQISTAGGAKPRWRGDGNEVFFVAPDGRIAAAEVSARNGARESSEPQMLLDPRMADLPPYTYDVSADGQRILAITPRSTTEGLTIVQNWPGLVKK